MKLLIPLLLLSLFSAHIDAEEEKTADVFMPAVAIERKPPQYPSSSLRRQEEGWVDLIFTVGKDATIRDIEAVEHSGVRWLVRPAVKSVSNYKFTPATLNGTPVDSLQEIRITFMMADTPRGADAKFVRRFRGFRKAILANDIDSAFEKLKALRALKANNFYEGAFLSLAEYYYGLANKADPKDLIDRLHVATARDDNKPYISQGAWIDAMRSLFILRAQVADYGQALKTYEAIPAHKRYTALRAELLPMVKQIKDLKSNDQQFATKIKLSPFGFGGTLLLKPVFAVSELKGEIEYIKMMCESKVSVIQFNENAEFQIPKSFGECFLRVKGLPDTEFVLHQLPMVEESSKAVNK